MTKQPNPLNEHPEPSQSGLQRRLEVIIFGTGTLAGRRFDMTLIAAILLSVAVVVLDSVPELDVAVGAGFWHAELCFTGLFTLEYITRVWCTHNRPAYVLSFWGIIDCWRLCPPTSLFYFQRPRLWWSSDY